MPCDGKECPMVFMIGSQPSLNPVTCAYNNYIYTYACDLRKISLYTDSCYICYLAKRFIISLGTTYRFEISKDSRFCKALPFGGLAGQFLNFIGNQPHLATYIHSCRCEQSWFLIS